MEARQSYEVPTRVVIDPITPILWAEPADSRRREIIARSEELF